MSSTLTTCGCSCSSGPNLIFSCSGAADVGELADQAARKLNREGRGKMFCLAGIGGQVSGIVKTTEAASSILAIDGCSLVCAKKSLEVAGFTKFNHIVISELGFEKGNTDVSPKAIDSVVNDAMKFLQLECQ
ncbi:putative zinc-binding protein [Desulfosediminicola flagellatus]|uniref:putative zinc-binding protein n=1 Tax=Desulfosediminicola flagellatus TaxID=2569541 RepID=UPI0010AD45E4|nr:putative zinc-binding protein [Desulfosediminicola flagellatus]